MTAVVRQFQTCTSASTDTGDWSSGQKRAWVDNQTGDLLALVFASNYGTGTIQIWGSQDNLATAPVLIQGNPSVVPSPMPDMVMACDQDSDGNLHCVAGYNDLSTVTYYWLYIRFVRVNGHVTRWYFGAAPLALPRGSLDSVFDVRADIKIGTLSDGTQVPGIIFQGSTGSNTGYACYGAYIDNYKNAPTVKSWAGTAGAVSTIRSVSNGSLTSNHGMQFLLTWEPTSGRWVTYVGTFNTDGYLSQSASTQWDIIAMPWARSGGAWAAETDIVVYTIPSGGADVPEVLGTYSVAGKACLLYYTQASGLAIGYVDSSGAWNGAWRQVSATTGRAYFGSMWTDGTRCAAAYINNGANETSVAGGLWSHDGTTGTTVTDSAPLNVISWSSMAGSWANGLVVLRSPGSSLGQSVNSTYPRQMAAVYFPAPTVTTQPSNQAGQPSGTITFNASATSSGGTLLAQWQSSTDGGATPVDISGATSTTSYSASSVLLADNGTLIRCKYTDDNGTAYTRWATLQVANVGPRTDASFGAGAFGAGAFGAPYIRSVDAGSSSYSGTLAESVSAVDGVSATLVANPSITEALTLADVISQVATMLATSAEAASLTDAVTAALVTSAVLSESQALADTLSELMAASTSNAESITAADQPSASNAASTTIAESVSSADAVSGTSSGTSGTLSESVAATDLTTAAATMAQVLSEAIACTETVTTTGTAFSVSLSDSASSSDVWAASVSALSAALSEAISASDSLTRTAQLSQAVSELNSLTDVLSAAGSFTVALVEAATLADAISWIDENVTPPADRIVSASYGTRTVAVPYQDRYLVVRYQSRTIH